MSGPIIRKYGFPNFEQIFGKRDLEHGIDQGKDKTPVADTPGQTPTTSQPTLTPMSPDATSKPDH